MTWQTLRDRFEWLLETIVIALVLALTAIVIAGFVFRYIGYALVWYDEVASVGLVWLTYYGSALAALKGAHIGVPGVVNAFSPRLRLAALVLAEFCVVAFFAVLAVAGIEVLQVLGNDRLVSLDWVPLRFTQSVIPIGAVLFIIAEIFRWPRLIREARGSGFVDSEIEEALHQAGVEADQPGQSDGGARR